MSRHLPPHPADLPSTYGGGGVTSSNKQVKFAYGDDDDRNDSDENNNTNQQKAELKRRCIDYHTPSILDVTSRLYRKSNKRLHAAPGSSGLTGYPYMQCHTNYLRHMGLAWGEGGTGGYVVPSCGYLTYCAHVTRAKNSSPVM